MTIKIILKILSVLLYLHKRLVFHICIGPNEKAVTEVYWELIYWIDTLAEEVGGASGS